MMLPAYALRFVARRPAFSTALVLTPALGIGANTAMFSLARAVVLRPFRIRILNAWSSCGTTALVRIDPAYVRTVDALDIWRLSSPGARGPLSRLKAPLEEIWLPYLDGRGTRDEAFAALLAKVSAQP